MDNELLDQTPHVFTQKWGPDPLKSDERGDSSSFWWNMPIHKAVRKSTNPEDWEQYWSKDADWSESKDTLSDALIALRAVVFMASQGSSEHIQSLTRCLDEGVIPDRPLDLWKESWMREKYVDALTQNKYSEDSRRLSLAIVERWPWVFAWTSESAIGELGYRHPVARAVRAGNHELAAKIMEIIPPHDWIDWQGRGRETYYAMRGIWRDQTHWFNNDISWINALVKIDPRVSKPHFATGLGPLEQAARDNLPELLRQFLAQGWKPDPEVSFGLTLSHWAINGLSEEKWNSKSGQKDPKTPEEIEDNASRCGQTLAVLAEFGYSMHDPVIKAQKVEGVRRPRLPKPKTTATQMLLDMQEKNMLKSETLAMLEQANMLATAPIVKIAQATRPRL